MNNAPDRAERQTILIVGAVDYLAKPISPPIVLARIETHLALGNAR